MQQPRFVDTITANLHAGLYQGNQYMTGMSETLDHPLTRRILVDADLWENLLTRDAATAGKPEPQPTWPFIESFYLEATRPILPGKMTTYNNALISALVKDGMNPDEEKSWLRGALVLPTGQHRRTVLTLATWGHQIISTTLLLDLTSGEATTDMQLLDPALSATITPSDVNRGITHFGNAVHALVAHINRRGIHLQPEPLTRASRRRLDRQHRPNPWYLIQDQ